MASLDTNGPDENTRPDGADDAPATTRAPRRAAAEPTAPAVERGAATRTARPPAARKPSPAPAEPSVAARKTLKDADGDRDVTEATDLPDREAVRAAEKAEREAATAAARAARDAARAERDAEEAAEKAERDARAAAEKAEREAAKDAERAARDAAKEAERAERDTARENERAQKAAAKATADAERQAAKEAAEAARREAKLTAKAEQIAAKEAEQARRAAAKEAERAEKASDRAAAKAEKAAAKEAAKAERAAARQARKPRRDLRPQPFGVITAADWERPAEAATVLFKRAEYTATEAIDWYLRHKRSRKRASRLLRALAILLVAAGLLVPLLAPAIAALHLEYGYALFGAAAACVAFDHFFGLSSGWMRDVVTAQAVHARLEALRFDWAAECARSALTTRRTMDEVDRQLVLLREFSDDVVALTSAETAEWMAEFRLSVAAARQRMGRASQARRAGAHAAERP